MRRLRVTYRPEALADLREIYRFILLRSASSNIAREFVRRIRTRCSGIGDVPFGGRPRDDLDPGLRTVPFERSAVIAYKVEDDRVDITNVFYGGRDFEAMYPGAPPGADDADS